MLGCFSDDVRSWFQARFGMPTAAQRLAWPIIAAGESLLLCTPTGSGKTLAGLLPILDRIRTKRRARLQALYLAPLKALVQDTYITLRQHNNDMEDGGFPIRLGVRTGDTSSRVRRHQLDDPPQILLTTPESLAVMLTQPGAVAVLRGLRWVVVDELHALACAKRGADMALSLERLERLIGTPGGLQRIGLSATCMPLSTAAEFLTGAGRPCRIVRVDDVSDMDLRVEPLAHDAGSGFLERLLARLAGPLAANRTTLVFTNTRNLAERLTWALRQRYPDRIDAIATHHSSLAPARRRLVERAMKQGRLWAVVSSTSLEVGIDIGSIDGVVFVHPPGSIVRLLQRLGRSGHRPGVMRRGLVLTAAPSALLEAAVTADCGRHGQIERLQVPEHPYDVLCQHLVGMAMTAAWEPEAAYRLVRGAFPYRNLSYDDFRECLDYLSGRPAGAALRLRARLRWDGDKFTIADERTARLLRRNLGTIVSDEPWAVRMPIADGRKSALVGELDPIYAERLQPGDRFMLDGRCLEYLQRSGSALQVDEVMGRPQAPRWHGAGAAMSPELASRLYLFRAQAGEALRDGPTCLNRFLREEYQLDGRSAASVSAYLTRQETISEIPDYGTLLIECLANQACIEYYVHTPLPGPANEAIVRVVAERLRTGLRLSALPMAADLGFIVVFEGAHEISPDLWRALLAADRFADDFDRALGESELLRERLMQVAQTGLLVLRHSHLFATRGRPRRWNGQRFIARLLLEAPSFALLRQARREAATSACDLAAALGFVRRLSQLPLRMRSLAEPSPLADSLLAGHMK
jgi:ATP-dependent Lhr-like helicase